MHTERPSPWLTTELVAVPCSFGCSMVDVHIVDQWFIYKIIIIMIVNIAAIYVIRVS